MTRRSQAYRCRGSEESQYEEFGRTVIRILEELKEGGVAGV